MDPASRQSSVAPDSSASSSPTTTSARFHPYHSPNHRVTKGRYITSTDPRGYVPVYEYPLNNQWIMMDVDDGYVLWTGIWKALGNSKADIVKMVEAQPELASQLRRVRGGYLKIQGTWLPYEVALRLARRVAWPIRDDLVPLFGPTFPDTCLAPDQPGYGQVVPSAGRKGKRSKYQTTAPMPGGAAPGATALSSDSEPNPNSLRQPHHHPNQHPYSPSSAGSTEAPGLEQSPSAYGGAPGGGQYYQAMQPTAAPGPPHHAHHHHPSYSQHQHQRYGGGGGEYYSPSTGTDESGGGGRNATSASTAGGGSGSRHRYAPYPPTGNSLSPSATPRQGQYPAPLPSPSPPLPRDHRYDLPSLSTMDLPRPPQLHPPQNQFALPPITSLGEPEMDASTVLRRLRLDEGGSESGGRAYQAVSSGGSGGPVQYPAGQPTFYGDERYYGVSDARGYAPPPLVPAQQQQRHPAVRGGAPAPSGQW